MKYLIFILGCVFALLFASTVTALTLNLPETVNEKDQKYKNVVLKNKTIPAVRKRNPDPSKGPRIPVKEFKIQGVTSYPDLSLSKEELDKIIESKRYEMMDEEFLQKSGYTIKELLELAGTLSKIGENNDGDYVELPDVQKLIWLLKEQKNNRGLTIGEIEEIAESVTTYYRTHGFFLAKAFVPKQDVRDGIVGLTVLEGVLGKVTVAGNDLYDSSFLSGIFKDLANKPVVYKDIEQKLYLLNDYPGLKVSGYFNPGDQIGDTHLNLNVLKENFSNSLIRLDNHGSEFTGQNRLYFQHQLNTPFGKGDQLSLGLMQTAAPDNSAYGSISYRIPVFNEKNYLHILYSTNQYTIQNSDSFFLGLAGKTEVTKFSYEHVLRRTRKISKSFRINLQNSISDVDSQQVLFNKFSDINALVGSYFYDFLSEKGKSLNNGKLLLMLADSNEITGDTKVKVDALNYKQENIAKINFTHSYLKFSNLPFTKQPVRYIAKINMQLTDSRMPSIEQAAIGGPDFTRAFLVTDYSADSSIHIGLDMHFNYPKWMDFKISSKLRMSNIANPYIFYDMAYGIQYSAPGATSNDDESAQLRGWGVGLEFKYKGNISGHLVFARPTYLLDTFENGSIEEGNKVIFDMQYNF